MRRRRRRGGARRDDGGDPTGRDGGDPTGRDGEAPGLAGVAGGFSGFEGAERYSWTEDSAAGRAIALAQKLKADGKAPDKLVVGSYAGSIGAYEEPFPEGAQAVNALWEELTGIKIEFVAIPPEQVFPKTVQMAATKDGSQNLIQMDYHSTGTLAEAGLIIPLTEWVDAYQPDWDDPETGYIGAPLTTQAFNYYNGEPYAVAQDGDLQLFCIRKDLFDDSKEQADFKAKYGYDLVAAEDVGRVLATWPSSSTGPTRGSSGPPTCARRRGAGSTSSTATSRRRTRSSSTSTTR